MGRQPINRLIGEMAPTFFLSGNARLLALMVAVKMICIPLSGTLRTTLYVRRCSFENRLVVRCEMEMETGNEEYTVCYDSVAASRNELGPDAPNKLAFR